MKVFILIIACKMLYKIGNLIGRGTSLPGKIILKLDKNILSKLKYPDKIIAITGSNGKTSTVEIVYNILKDNNLNVISNLKGSNQIEGITTLLLNNSDYKGNIKADVIVLETDERYAKYTFSYFDPTHVVITNIYRDQMSRNAHPEFIYEEIKKIIKKDTHLVLNADDPISSSYGFNSGNVTYFGMENIETDTKENTGVYNDGKYCLVCNDVLEYEYYHYDHIGSYKCNNCGFKKNKPDYYINDFDFENSSMKINDKYKVNLVTKNMYMAYNFLAAFSIASLIGIKEDNIIKTINNYIIKNDRIQKFHFNNKIITLLTSKHENSISYNQSFRYVASLKQDSAVCIVIDQISRKYFTSETSWVWDIDFNILNSDNIKEIIISGRYVSDIAVRLIHSLLPQDKIIVTTSIDEMMDKIDKSLYNKIYVVTCFSDRDKVKKRIPNKE